VPILEFIAQRLRELRRKHDLTQEQVATLLRTDLRWYQRVELKQKDIRASTIDRFATIYGVTSVEFLAEKVPETKVVTRPASAPHKPRTIGKRKARGAR
jgi:transcriptional regulator with XRE-family HTH domain